MCNRRRSLNRRWEGGDVLYMNLWRWFLLVSWTLWITPTRPSKRPAAGRGASLCLPFVMRCHLALLAVRSLLFSACDTHHEYDSTFSAFPLLIGWNQTPPGTYSDAQRPPIGPVPRSAPPLLQKSRSILMRQARLCFLHLLVVLWSFGVGGEGCRPDSGSRSRRRRRRRLQPCQFAVSWTACEKNQPWPCRWALMMRTTTQTLSRLAH